MSLRLRLALLYTLVLSVTLILSGVILLLVLRRTLVGEVDRSLVAMAQGFDARRWLRNGPGNTTVFTAEDRNVETWTEVFNRQRELVAYSDNLSDRPLRLDEAMLDDVLAGVPRFKTMRHQGAAVRLYAAPIVLDGRARGAVVLARTLSPIPRTLATVQRTLLWINLLLVALAFASGLALARAALRPMDRITRTAAAIGEGLNFNRRVTYHGPNDELGRLARTFNSMLDRVSDAYTDQQTALEAQRRFVADASHDLRTPITSIIGNLQFLRRAENLPAVEREGVLQDIGAAAGRMQLLVADLLVLARADGCQMQLRCDRVPAHDLLVAVAHEARSLNTGKEIDVAADPAVTLLGDREALHRILMILVDNALKHTGVGGRVVLLAERQGTGVCLHVTDNGVGIAPEHLPHIFERFYRADPARSGAGTGLGLSIAQATMTAMGGSITVESTPGIGSRFTLDLPDASLAPSAANDRELKAAL